MASFTDYLNLTYSPIRLCVAVLWDFLVRRNGGMGEKSCGGVVASQLLKQKVVKFVYCIFFLAYSGDSGIVFRIEANIIRYYNFNIRI